MLVDARWPPPEPEPDRPPLRWPRYRWPLLTILFLVATQVAPPLVAYVCLILSLYGMVESFALLMPDGDGLGKHRQ
jgi:hypothetical protein